MAARNTVYGVSFLDQASRPVAGNILGTEYEQIAKVGSRQSNIRPSQPGSNYPPQY